MQKLEILLGNSYSGNTKLDEKIIWTPKTEHNAHLLLIGGSGSGKTETIKSIIFELNKQKINTLVIDFHDDFKQLSDNIIDFEKNGATIHPLEILANERPIDVAYRVSQMFKNIFRLGDIQFSIIRESIKDFYNLSGILNFHEKVQTPVKLLPFKRFSEVMRDRGNGSDVEKLISKIAVIFDTPLFVNADQTTIPFEDILKKTSVLKLNDYPTEEVKSLIAEIILRKLINYLYIKGKSDLELYCVIDEAHRLAYEGSPIDQMLREARKYGLGLILASQSADDFSETIRSNTSAYLGFRANSDKDAVALSKVFQIDKSNFRNLLSPGLGYSLFSSKNKAQKLRIDLVKDRPGYDKVAKHFDEDKNAEYFNASMNIKKRELEEQNRIKRELDKYMKLSKEQNTKLSEKENKIIDLTSELSNLSGKIEKYTFEIANYKKEILKLSELNLKKDELLENLKSELSDVIKQNKHLLEKIEDLSSKLKKKDKDISLLESKATEDLKKLESKVAEDLQKIKNLQKNILDLTNKLKNIRYLLNNEKRSKQVLELFEEFGDFEPTTLKNPKYCSNCSMLIKNTNKYCECCGEEL